MMRHGVLAPPSPDTCTLCTIKETYCIHIQVYLFAQVHVHLSIGLIIIYIGAFRRHVNYQSKIPLNANIVVRKSTQDL